MARSGDHYWVLAHVTLSFAAGCTILGYRSNRRLPDRAELARVEPVYAALLAKENHHVDRRAGLATGHALLAAEFRRMDMRSDQFLFSIPGKAA
jgi:hypothetical protein